MVFWRTTPAWTTATTYSGLPSRVMSAGAGHDGIGWTHAEIDEMLELAKIPAMRGDRPGSGAVGVKGIP